MSLQRLRPAVVAAVATTSFLALGAGTAATAAPACSTVEQLTFTTTEDPVISPRLSDDGSTIVFSSTEDLAGTNGDGNLELFTLDVASRVVTQITDTTGPAGQLEPAIDGDGDRVAFVSFRDLTGDNADGNQELFLHDATGPSLTQLTDTVGGSMPAAVGMDDSGTVIAFSTDRNLGGGNPDGNLEVFLLDTEGSGTQVTASATGSSDRPVVSDDGTVVVFESNADLTGQNADGNGELFRWSSADGVDQLTTTAGVNGAVRPSLDDTASVVGFDTNADLIGSNPDLNGEIFRLEVDGAGTSLEQVTDVDPPDPEDGSFGAAVSGDGERLAYVSIADDLDENADGGQEVFLQARPNSRAQITHLPAGVAVGDIEIDQTGVHLTYVAAADVLGTNPDANAELFHAVCGPAAPIFTDVPPSNAFFEKIQWMAAAEIANGFDDGTFRRVDPVKRQQMANFLYNLAGRPHFELPVTPTFTDVPTTSFFYAPIEWMAAEGIAGGFSDGTFLPNDGVKRQQMANFLYNLAGRPEFIPPHTPTFTDVAPGTFFYAAIEWMAAEEVASGFRDGTYLPLDIVKRQQMANFLHNLTRCCLGPAGPS